jgi:hypothetical protein
MSDGQLLTNRAISFNGSRSHHKQALLGPKRGLSGYGVPNLANLKHVRTVSRCQKKYSQHFPSEKRGLPGVLLAGIKSALQNEVYPVPALRAHAWVMKRMPTPEDSDPRSANSWPLSSRIQRPCCPGCIRTGHGCLRSSQWRHFSWLKQLILFLKPIFDSSKN